MEKGFKFFVLVLIVLYSFLDIIDETSEELRHFREKFPFVLLYRAESLFVSVLVL